MLLKITGFGPDRIAFAAAVVIGAAVLALIFATATSRIDDGIFIGVLLRAMAIYPGALAVPVFGNHGLFGALTVLSVARRVTMGRAAPAVLRKAPQARR